MSGMLAGERDRDRAVALLREHYAEGRLTLEQLGRRVDRVLHARSRWQIGIAFVGLPVLTDSAPAKVRGVARGAVLVLLSGAWLVFSFTLLVLLGIVLLVHGASAATLLGFLAVWLVPTWLLGRAWRR
jgi:Domain of unknown function (DUF1707)